MQEFQENGAAGLRVPDGLSVPGLPLLGDCARSAMQKGSRKVLQRGSAQKARQVYLVETMKMKLPLFCLVCLVTLAGCTKYPDDPVNLRYPVGNWPEPVRVWFHVITLEGFVQVDTSHVERVGTEVFNVRFVVGSEQTGGKIAPVVGARKSLAALVGARVRITGRIEHKKDGSCIRIETLEVRGVQQKVDISP